MGQAGSHPAAGPQSARRVNTLPHEPPRHAPKVLPSLTASPRLRSTDNGAILHSGGTISGRRPNNMHDAVQVPNGHVHATVYRSRSAGGSDGSSGELRSRERDPLHRSHTNLDFRHNEGNMNKRFGSEPDLRVEEEQQKARSSNKHFRKKYRAPPPPSNDQYEGSSPDSSDGNARQEPQRKLRLFKTRNETKKLNGMEKSPFTGTYAQYKSLELSDQAFERRYRSPYKEKEQHCKYPDNKDMIQSSASLKREEKLLQARQEFKKSRVSGCRAKTSKTSESTEVWKTPLLNRNFRYSDRLKEDGDSKKLRREKTFDETLLKSEKESDLKAGHDMKALKEQLKSKLEANNQLRKSLPSLLAKNNEEKDEFQAELKKATSRIRNELGDKINVSENTSQSALKPNPTKVQSKVKESSLKADTKPVYRRPLARTADVKGRSNLNSKVADSKQKFSSKESGRSIPDSRGQASGKESTPEHSPTRSKTNPTKPSLDDKQKQVAPSKQFYFGMVESKQVEPRNNLKDFPGLGTPIIEEIRDFHLIERKLLGYDDDDEIEKFNAKLKEETAVRTICKNISSSSLSSEGGSGRSGGSGASPGIAVRLCPAVPKKQPEPPKFSPAAAWRHLAGLDAYLIANSQSDNTPVSLAVDVKLLADISPDSSPRSDQSAEKSGDSGISADHGNHRVDSPRLRKQELIPTWTPQQDLGDSSSEGAGPMMDMEVAGGPLGGHPMPTFSPASQPFSLSLPRESHERGKQLQQGFNSLQKFRKSVSGALGAALGGRRFDIEHEPMLDEPQQNWFLTKSAPNSLSNPFLYQPGRKGPSEEDIKEEPASHTDKVEHTSWHPGNSYLSRGGHVMYLPPANATEQPLSILGPIDRPIRSKSSSCLEASARAARAARGAGEGEMRERERSASPDVKRALPARVEPAVHRASNATGKGKRFTFQSTVRQLERRKIAEKLSKEADLKEQQRRTELEAMRRVEEEFQRKRAREKANIRQQLRLVSSGANSMPHSTQNTKTRDEPDGSCRESPASDRNREKQRHSNASSEISGRSKSSTPIRCVELSEWRTESPARVYRDWASGLAAHAHAHPPACARMPMSTHLAHNAGEVEAFSGSPRSDNYRLEFARGRSPRTPRPPRLLSATRSPSTSGSEMSLRQPIKIRSNTGLNATNGDSTNEDLEEPNIVPIIQPGLPSRKSLAIR